MYYAKKSLPIDSINIFSYFFLLNIFDDPNKKLAIPECSGWIFYSLTSKPKEVLFFLRELPAGPPRMNFDGIAILFFG